MLKSPGEKDAQVSLSIQIKDSYDFVPFKTLYILKFTYQGTDGQWMEYNSPKFLNSEDLHVMLLCHNFNIRTILHFILSLLQNQSSC